MLAKNCLLLSNFRHTALTKELVQNNLKQSLVFTFKRLEDQMEKNILKYNDWMRQGIDQKTFKSIVTHWLFNIHKPAPKETDEETGEKTNKKFEIMLERNKPEEKTIWGAYNFITESVSHLKQNNLKQIATLNATRQNELYHAERSCDMYGSKVA